MREQRRAEAQREEEEERSSEQKEGCRRGAQLSERRGAEGGALRENWGAAEKGKEQVCKRAMPYVPTPQ